MIKIGLTGNIASGKSEVERIIRLLGYKVIDLDIVCHDLLNNDKSIKDDVFQTFKTIDRKKIAKIVFSSNEEKNKLENIFFPRLKEFILSFFQKNTNEKAVFISGALLYEAGFDDIFDKIIYITASYNTRLSRLMKRNNLDETQAKKRLDCQKDYSKFANYIIQNDDNIENLKEKVVKILEDLML